MRLIVLAPSGDSLLDGPALIEAARKRFGPEVRVQTSPEGWETDFHLYASLDGDSLIVSHFADDTSVSFETSGPLLREVIAWYRSLLPREFPRVIACDEGWNGHVDLTPGITADEVASRWVDHSIEGWNAGDPNFG